MVSDSKVSTFGGQPIEYGVRESEERFRNMANCAPVLLWMSGRDKLCDFFNQGWLAFTGRSMEQEVGSGWTQGVHPDDMEHCLQTYHSSFDARRPFEMEYRLRRHDGAYRWILDTGVPRFCPNGEFVGYVGSGVDINDRKEAEESYWRIAQLQRLVSIGELTTAIAHGLTQPLTAIRANLDAIERPLHAEKLDVKAVNDVLSAIRFDAARISKVVELIRDLAVRRDASSELLDLNSLVSETLQLLASEALRRHVQVRTELYPGIPPVIANRTQLRQVLMNLALNGMEAMATTTTRQLLVKATVNEDDHVQVTVSDSGTGIDPTVAPHLFKRFATNKKEGVGLGLFVARSIIESHRGNIWVSNNPEGGASFHFAVPLAQDQRPI